MAAQIPVCRIATLWPPYLIEDAETGFLVDPENPRHIAEKIHLLLSNPRMAFAMGERARGISLNRFHAHVVAERTVAVYNEILKERAS